MCSARSPRLRRRSAAGSRLCRIRGRVFLRPAHSGNPSAKDASRFDRIRSVLAVFVDRINETGVADARVRVGTIVKDLEDVGVIWKSMR